MSSWRIFKVMLGYLDNELGGTNLSHTPFLMEEAIYCISPSQGDSDFYALYHLSAPRCLASDIYRWLLWTAEPHIWFSYQPSSSLRRLLSHMWPVRGKVAGRQYPSTVTLASTSLSLRWDDGMIEWWIMILLLNIHHVTIELVLKSVVWKGWVPIGCPA